MIDLKKTTHEMIKNGTWKFENGIFWQALPSGVVGYNGEDFTFPDHFGKREKKEAEERIRFILGLDTNLEKFYSEIQDSKFAFLVDEFYGLTMPAAPTPYQAIVEVIAQQQISFEFAQKAIYNLVKLIGKRIGDLYLFPEPKDILKLGERIKEAKLGYRGDYILNITQEYVKGNLRLDLWELNEKDATKYLTKFRGIGRWSAELFLMYGLRKNVYPASDLGILMRSIPYFSSSFSFPVTLLFVTIPTSCPLSRSLIARLCM